MEIEREENCVMAAAAAAADGVRITKRRAEGASNIISPGETSDIPPRCVSFFFFPPYVRALSLQGTFPLLLLLPGLFFFYRLFPALRGPSQLPFLMGSFVG